MAEPGTFEYQWGTLRTRRLRLGQIDDDSWKADGSCVGADQRPFFPSKGAVRKESLEAKAVCRGCKVKQKCLDYAIHNSEDYGIWGGMTEKERRAYARVRNHKVITAEEYLRTRDSVKNIVKEAS